VKKEKKGSQTDALQRWCDQKTGFRHGSHGCFHVDTNTNTATTIQRLAKLDNTEIRDWQKAAVLVPNLISISLILLSSGNRHKSEVTPTPTEVFKPTTSVLELHAQVCI
jgi:hypothetical protein